VSTQELEMRVSICDELRRQGIVDDTKYKLLKSLL
jgi:hypothetical protein